ncbi:sensor histidine kinase [Terricaulis sp.]|uniref:sensor histidine kinase n=1 Tax=Terricaulis sp. TaxID=2768686 RepID=UPI0037833DF5
MGFIRSGKLWRALIAIATVQLFFWFVYYPQIVKRPAMPQLVAEAENLREGVLSAPTYTAASQAQLDPVASLPMHICCAPGYRALRWTFNLEQVPDHGLVLLPAFGADNHFLYVNGQFADGRGRLDLPDITYHHNDFRMIRIMPGQLRQGENEFVVIAVRAGATGFDYYPVMAFDAREFRAPHERREFVISIFSWMQLATAMLVTLFAFLMTVRSRDRAQPFWLFLVAACWMLFVHFYKWTDPPIDGDARNAYINSLFVLLPYACLGWAEFWSPRRMRWILPVATVALLAFLALIWRAAIMLPVETRFDAGNFYSSLGGLCFSVAAAVRLAWGAIGMDERRAWELAFALPLPVGLAVDTYGELTQQTRPGIAEISMPLLVTGLLVAFFARNVRLFSSQEQINSLLKVQLDERTAQLEAAHSRERVLVREQAHEAERQRILRDMHDGVGSQLISMLVAARRGNLAPQRMAEQLQSVVDEMRLLIASMDSVGESLTSALALFRERIEPRAAEAGLALRWTYALTTPPPAYGPREVLQVFRILQEAVANALKHAQAATLSISVAPGTEAFPVRIEVADDGRGLAPEPGSGRGLDNMARRAAVLGARLDVRNAATGVAVVLELPAREES